MIFIVAFDKYLQCTKKVSAFVMKKILTFIALFALVHSTYAQSPFIKRVGYRGAFAPAPAAQWTDGWTEFDPQNALYGTPTVTLSGSITSNTTLSASTVYLISGLVYVKNNATLTIPAGTVLLGDATVANSSLVITKGSKLIAVGTSSSPIVFSSSKAAGSRAKGDWGGLIILGKASCNKTNGIGNIEGITPSADTEYGGGLTPDDDDNSGSLKYVRVEFGGYVFATDNEINGVTFGAVGRNTTVDYVQCSFTNDDSFEWFGGTVNCSHLVAYRGLDDDFDTDNGFSGSVQFALSVRDPQIADQSAGSTSEGFESDNDATGSTATPYTSAVFSNITIIGPYRGSLSNTIDAKFRRAVRIRRASRLKVLNSIFMDFPTGVFIDGTVVRANLATGNTVFKNNIVAGYESTNGKFVEIGTASTLKDSLITTFNNDSLPSTSGILTSPYDFASGDYRPAVGSPALSDTNFTDASITSRVIVETLANYIKEVAYRGAFAPAPAQPWTNGWVEWDPSNKVYGTPTVTVSGNITTNTTWSKSNVYLLQGLVYVKNGATLTIEAGTVIRGDASVANSALIITKGAKINAAGTASEPIVFTSSKGVGSRAKGDWGGVIILGRASLNKSGGIGNIEGITPSTDTEYGGGVTPNDDDNSGVLTYVRIEFGGYVFATDNEINGLTMGAVGRGTTINHVQCSFTNDDSFEWFGGSVNCSHLVAYRGLDDDFDTDNGFSGSVQFGLSVRDPQIADQSAGSTSEGFESDNDATGSTATPFTSALFTNITVVGPYRGSTSNTIDSKFRRAARIRRSSKLKVFNSIFMDFPTGVFIDGSTVRGYLGTGDTKFKNNIVAGFGTAKATEIGTAATLIDSLFNASKFKNDSIVASTGILVSPYDFTNPDYRPSVGSAALTNYDFTDAAFTGKIADCETVSASTITGTSNVYLCSGNLTYTAQPGYETYNWIVPSNVTIVSGQGTASLVVNYTQPAFVSGTLQLTAGNNCGNTASSTLSIVELKPSTPGSITGPANSCPYVSSVATYSIAPVAGASSYLWTINTAQTGSYTIVTGQGTTSITANFSPAYISGAVTVSSVTGCYTSAAKILTVLKKTPAIPSAITGPADVCDVIGTDVTYTCPDVVGATSYTWGIPAGATLVSGQGTTSVVINFPSTYTSGSLTVKSNAACGSSANKTLIVAKKIPAIPGTITGITDVCDSISASKDVLYSIAPVALATSYVWSINTPNASIVSGQGTTSVLVRFTSAYTSGVLSVKAARTCGESPAKVLVIYKKLPKAPAYIAGPTNVCPDIFANDTVSYSIPAVDLATSYTWTVPTGVTIVSGQGTQNLVVTFASSFAAGAFTAKGVRGCGDGIAKVLVVKKLAPAQPGDITGSAAPVKGSTGNVYTIASVDYATSYSWTLPAGATITSGAGTNSITVTFSATAAAGNISVKASSVCGLSAARTLAIAPVAPGPRPALGGVTSKLQAEIFPNPNNGSFTININTGVVETEVAQVQILDASGRMVKQLSGINNNGVINLKVVNLSLSNGVYSVKCTVGSQIKVIRMVIQR